MRERIKRNAVCSSKNYTASKRVHRAWLEERHSTFELMAKSKMGDTQEESTLSLDRQMAISNAKVKVRVFDKVMTITKAEYEEHYAPAGFSIIG